MTEPKRWVDDGAPVAIERMLRAAGDEQPSASSLERALAGAGVGAAVLTATSGTAAAGGAAKSATVLGSLFTKWHVLIVVVGAATGVSIAHYRAASSLPARDAAPSVGYPAERGARSMPVSTAVASPVQSATQAEALPTPSRRTTPAPSADAVDTTVTEETKRIDSVNAALGSGNPAAALSLLDGYQARFPAGQLAPEALYLRMKALLAQGRTAEARQAAARLLAQYPNSPQAGRAEAVLGRTNP